MGKLECLVTLPNQVTLSLDIDGKSDGQFCLEKALERYHIIETDYFGLRYEGKQGEHLWINLRNQIGHQLQASKSPYRLQLRVKFWVQPHYLQQPATRELFYQNSQQDFSNDRLHSLTSEQVVQIAALVAQAELGDTSSRTAEFLHDRYYVFIPESFRNDDIVERVFEEHTKHTGLDAQQSAYRALKHISELQCYGVEYWDQIEVTKETLPHLITRDSEEGDSSDKGAGHHSYQMAVGQSGVTVYDGHQTLLKSIDYTAISKATVEGRNFCIHTVSDSGSEIQLHFRLQSKNAANAVYRSITEKWTFYVSDTVRDPVTHQFTRDLKGAMASFFNEHSTVGKSYVFDIRRTFRETYDYARRMIYSQANQRVSGPRGEVSRGEVSRCASPCVMDTSSSQAESMEAKYMEMQAMLRKFQEDFLCNICYSDSIGTVLIPCGHMCCGSCSAKIESCHMCRESINSRQAAFMPGVKPQQTLVS